MFLYRIFRNGITGPKEEAIEEVAEEDSSEADIAEVDSPEDSSAKPFVTEEDWIRWGLLPSRLSYRRSRSPRKTKRRCRAEGKATVKEKPAQQREFLAPMRYRGSLQTLLESPKRKNASLSLVQAGSEVYGKTVVESWATIGREAPVPSIPKWRRQVPPSSHFPPQTLEPGMRVQHFSSLEANNKGRRLLPPVCTTRPLTAAEALPTRLTLKYKQISELIGQPSDPSSPTGRAKTSCVKGFHFPDRPQTADPFEQFLSYRRGGAKQMSETL